jgi:hypothetical protein
VSIDGVPVEPYTMRVTQVYRREDGQWTVVHRHGDQILIDPIVVQYSRCSACLSPTW